MQNKAQDLNRKNLNGNERKMEKLYNENIKEEGKWTMEIPALQPC